MHEEDGKPSSAGGTVAAWAGSIILHVGVILGLYWVAPSLMPAPESRAELQVTMLESVVTTPPDIQSSETAGADGRRAVMTPPLRMATLTPPVVRSRSREIATVPATAVEARPARRSQARSVLPASARQRSVVPARHPKSVEADVAIRSRPPAATFQARPVQQEGGGERLGLDVRTSSRIPEGESVATVSSPAPAPAPVPITLRKSPAVTSRPSAETSPGARPPVVRAERGATGLRVLEQAPAPARVAHPPDPVALKTIVALKPVEEDVAGTRTGRVVQPQAERRVARRAPELASLPLRQRSGSGSSDSISDYGWLAQAVHRRIAELKRYPHRARVNHLEGRVVLRAVIRDDGELAALSVRTSSGHHELDEEAMELVRQICPVPLRHPLGRSEITMHIPITYTLDH